MLGMLALKLSSGCMIAEIMLGVKARPGREKVQRYWCTHKMGPESKKFVRGSMETNKVKSHQRHWAWHGIRGKCTHVRLHRLAGWQI